MMERPTFLAMLTGGCSPRRSPSRRSRRGRCIRVGWVTSEHLPFLANFREGMRDLGYVEGRNIVIEEFRLKERW
jgi:hypothetical protein